MAKYIDAEKLIAEIKRLQKFNHNMADNATNSNMRNFYDGAEDCGKQLISFIDSLQKEQPEVDLEKEITRWLNEGHITDTRFDDYDDADIETTARHFYELGLNTKKRRIANDV